MTGWRFLGALLLVAGVLTLVGSVFAGEEKLEWKAFDKDKMAKTFYQILETKTNQTMTVNNMEVKQEQSQTFYIKWIPDSKKGKNWVVTQAIIGVKMEIDIGGNKIAYDSTEANPQQNPMADFFKALTQAELIFHINSEDFKISEIEGVEKFRKKLTETNPQMEALLKNILSEGALKQMAEPTWAAFPPGGKMKKTWENKSTLDLGPIGVYKFDNTYSQDAKDKDKINIKSNLKYETQTKKELQAGLPFVIKAGQLSSKKDGEGYAIFDKAKGRFSKSELKMEIDGDLTIDIGGMETKVTLNQNQTAKVTTQDDDPVAAIKAKQKAK